MGITYSDPDVDADEHIVQIAALTPTDNAVIIGNGTAWTAESGSTLRASLGLAIGSDVMAYDSDLADWAGVNPSSYLTAAAAASTYLTTSAAALAYQPLDSDLTAWAGVNPSSYSTTAQIAAAYQPLDADLTSWADVTRAAGFDAFVATPSSANLRTLLSDESGSGALLFAGGALGTPASGVLTNCTGLPNASVVGLGTAAVVNTGTSGATIPLLNGTNTWSALQTFTADLNINNAAPTLNLVETGLATYSIMVDGQEFSVRPNGVYASAFKLNTSGFATFAIGASFGATPMVAGDPVMTRGATETITGQKTISVANLGLLLSHATNPYWQVTNTTGSVQLFGQSLSTGARFGTLTNHNLEILTNSSTVATIYSGGGLVIGSPTGGDKGAGTLNASAVYDDNTLLSCYVFDAALDGAVSMTKWDAKVPDRKHPARYDVIEQEVGDEAEPPLPRLVAEAYTEERTHIPARKFTSRLGTRYDPLTLDGYERHWKEKRHLTAFPNEKNFDPIADAHSTGEWVQRLIEDAEIKAVLIAELKRRLAALEAAQ